MLYYTRLSRFLDSKTSPSICPVNAHCKYSRKGHDMQNVPNLFDYGTIFFSQIKDGQCIYHRYGFPPMLLHWLPNTWTLCLLSCQLGKG